MVSTIESLAASPHLGGILLMAVRLPSTCGASETHSVINAIANRVPPRGRELQGGWGVSDEIEGSLARICAVLQDLDRTALAEDEHAPHVVLVLDDELGPGPAAGPFAGALYALEAAEKLEDALKRDGSPTVHTRVLRLFTPPRG